jgi:hypothetical protein
MNIFSSTVKGPDMADLKATFENIQATLSTRDYADGIDQATTIAMIGGIYKYITGRLGTALPLPAPVDYPDDKHRVMWPEGMKVKTRRGSVSSTGSNHHVRRRPNFDLNPNIATPKAMSRASSVTSTSQYSSRYVGIAEEEEDVPPPRRKQEQVPPPRRRDSHRYQDEYDEMPLRPRQPARGTGTNRVSGAAMKPTPSMENFMRGHPDEDDEEEVVHAPRPPRRAAGRKPKFADDEE